MLLKALMAAALAVAAPGLALAQDAPPAPCAAPDANLPPPFTAWRDKADVVSATGAAGLGAAALQPGRAARVTLHGAGQVTFPTTPGKAGAPGTYAGLLRVSIDAAGAWRVALASPAWIDVTRDGVATASAAHGHGPACSTIHKIVDFPLQRGDYVLQISGNADPQTAVLVFKAP